MDLTGLFLGFFVAMALGGLLLVAGAVTRWRVRRPRLSPWVLVVSLVPGLVVLALAVSWVRSIPHDPTALDARRLTLAATACVGADGAGSASVVVDRVEDGPLVASPWFWSYPREAPVYVVTVTDPGGGTQTCRLTWSTKGNGGFQTAT